MKEQLFVVFKDAPSALESRLRLYSVSGAKVPSVILIMASKLFDDFESKAISIDVLPCQKSSDLNTQELLALLVLADCMSGNDPTLRHYQQSGGVFQRTRDGRAREPIARPADLFADSYFPFATSTTYSKLPLQKIVDYFCVCRQPVIHGTSASGARVCASQTVFCIGNGRYHDGCITINKGVCGFCGVGSPNLIPWLSEDIGCTNTCPVDTVFTIMAVHASQTPHYLRSLAASGEAGVVAAQVLQSLRFASTLKLKVESKRAWIQFLLRLARRQPQTAPILMPPQGPIDLFGSLSELAFEFLTDDYPCSRECTACGLSTSSTVRGELFFLDKPHSEESMLQQFRNKFYEKCLQCSQPTATKVEGTKPVMFAVDSLGVYSTSAFLALPRVLTFGDSLYRLAGIVFQAKMVHFVAAVTLHGQFRWYDGMHVDDFSVITDAQLVQRKETPAAALYLLIP